MRVYVAHGLLMFCSLHCHTACQRKANSCPADHKVAPPANWALHPESGINHMMMAYSHCSAVVVLSERVEYTVQRALFRSLGTALGGDVGTTAAYLLLSPIPPHSALSRCKASPGSCPERPTLKVHM